MDEFIKIYNAKKRILNIENLDLKFVGIFLSDNISTHYVNFAYEIKICKTYQKNNMIIMLR